MNKREAHTDFELIAKYLAGEMSVDEMLEMEQWIQYSDEHRQLFESCKIVFDTPINSKAQEPSFDSAPAWDKVAARIGVATKPETPVIQMEPQTKQKTSIPWMRIAAAAVIVLAAGFYFFTKPDPLTTIASGDFIREVWLPDSSKVTLNQFSSIAFKPNFGKNHRNLTLDGNAYFDVKLNAITFSIQTDIGVVEVLGTAFAISQSTDSLQVTVERGRVLVQSAENASINTILERSEKAILTGSTLEKETVTSLNDLYWANKRLVYRQATLTQVLKEMEDLFDKSIQYDSTAIAACLISAIFKEESFESMMDNMAISLNFAYTTSGDVVHITSNGCEEN